MHVLIVGAGVGGLSLAQCLRKQGISYEIFERDNNEDARFQGWAIGIHSIINDIKAAFPEDLGDLEAATNHLAPLSHLSAQMALYFPGREGRLGIEDTPETPIIRAERYRLRRYLLTNLEVQWGKRVSRIDDNAQGVNVFFQDGTSAKGDVLVGADGIKSIVRAHITGRSDAELLNVIPLAAVVGELEVSGEAFKRQLELGHSAYVYNDPTLGYWNFSALHHVLPDGVSGKYYWMWMQGDPKVAEPDHWLQTATQQEKLDHVLKEVIKMPANLRELFESTKAEGIKKQTHIWRDLELESLPGGRVVLVGDAAHAMTPFRGEGAYHAFIDAMNLSKVLTGLDIQDNDAIKAATSAYNAEMLERGTDAVRCSRNEQGAKVTKQGKLMSAGQVVRPLPMEDIILTPIQVQP